MDEAMRLPRWITRDRVAEERREQSSDLIGSAVMADLEGLRWQLENTVRGLESMVEQSKDDS